MNQNDAKEPVGNDVLQSDHHVHMTDEEIAKARAHHDKRHHGDAPQQNAGKKKTNEKRIPVQPR